MTISYSKISDIPPYLASRTEWERRGYKVKPDQIGHPVARMKASPAYHLRSFNLYDNSQIDLIRGKKAEARRLQYVHE